MRKTVRVRRSSMNNHRHRQKSLTTLTTSTSKSTVPQTSSAKQSNLSHPKARAAKQSWLQPQASTNKPPSGKPSRPRNKKRTTVSHQKTSSQPQTSVKANKYLNKRTTVSLQTTSSQNQTSDKVNPHLKKSNQFSKKSVDSEYSTILRLRWLQSKPLVLVKFSLPNHCSWKNYKPFTTCYTRRSQRWVGLGLDRLKVDLLGSHTVLKNVKSKRHRR